MMATETRDSGWVEERSTGGTASDAHGWGEGPSPAILDLTAFAGVKELGKSDVPADVVAHTKSDWYRIRGYYQLDNVDRWRAWKRTRDSSGGREIWLFYACPLSMVEAVLGQHRVVPYGEFFPRVFGEEAIYLFGQATSAGRVALKFGVECEGFLISCRLATGEVFRTRQGNPRATQLPKGYDTVMAPEGTDLGSGPMAGDMYAAFDPDRVLMRYVTHVVHSARR